MNRFDQLPEDLLERRLAEDIISLAHVEELELKIAPEIETVLPLCQG
jgi:hypothetical protein